MDIIVRGIIIYFFLFILFRISGKKSVDQSTPFGLVLILVISESVQNALIIDDRSMLGGILLATTFMAIHFSMELIKRKSRTMMRIIEDVPTLLVREGVVYEDILKKAKVQREDILYAARQQKVTKIEDIKFAILETDGSISVIPAKGEG